MADDKQPIATIALEYSDGDIVLGVNADGLPLVKAVNEFKPYSGFADLRNEIPLEVVAYILTNSKAITELDELPFGSEIQTAARKDIKKQLELPSNATTDAINAKISEDYGIDVNALTATVVGAASEEGKVAGKVVEQTQSSTAQNDKYQRDAFDVAAAALIEGDKPKMKLGQAYTLSSGVAKTLGDADKIDEKFKDVPLAVRIIQSDEGQYRLAVYGYSEKSKNVTHVVLGNEKGAERNADGLVKIINKIAKDKLTEAPDFVQQYAKKQEEASKDEQAVHRMSGKGLFWQSFLSHEMTNGGVYAVPANPSDEKSEAALLLRLRDDKVFVLDVNNPELGWIDAKDAKAPGDDGKMLLPKDANPRDLRKLYVDAGVKVNEIKHEDAHKKIEAALISKVEGVTAESVAENQTFTHAKKEMGEEPTLVDRGKAMARSMMGGERTDLAIGATMMAAGFMFENFSFLQPLGAIVVGQRVVHQSVHSWKNREKDDNKNEAVKDQGFSSLINGLFNKSFNEAKKTFEPLLSVVSAEVDNISKGQSPAPAT